MKYINIVFFALILSFFAACGGEGSEDVNKNSGEEVSELTNTPPMPPK